MRARRLDPKFMRRRFIAIALVVLILLLLLVLGRPGYQKYETYSYPQQYAEFVDHWSTEYSLDPLMVDAFIRTESGFDAKAQSNVDARGLMQITEVTFAWIKSKIAASETITFDDLYDPETNIRFGCYYLYRCLDRYHGDLSTASAAYHSGWGTVDLLLSDPAYSSDGQRLDIFPYDQMNHYVAKISSSYQRYQELYRPKGESET